MQQLDLTQGSIVRNIFSFSLPYMLAYFLQTLYGLADLFIIGQYCGVEETTAVSNGAQVMHMFTCIIIGLAMGSTVHIARATGARDRAGAARVVGNSATMFLLLSVVATVVLLFLIGNIIGIMRTLAEAVESTRHYLTICFLGIPFIVAYNIIASIYRGLGDSRTPMRFVAVACAANVLLDYLFIGALGLGAAGAALGTVLSQMTSVAYAFLAIRKHREAIACTRNDFRPHRRTMANILKIGFPIALQNGFIQVSFVVIAIIANMRGLNDAAAVGIVEKIIGLLFIVPSAMLSTVSAITAQNIGARNPQRAASTLRYSLFITATFGIFVSLILQFLPEGAVRIFTDDATVAALGGEYLRSYVWDCPLAGIHFCFSGYFTAYGFASISFIHNFLSIILARLPLSYCLSIAFPATLFPMGWASPAGSCLSATICITLFFWMKRRGKFLKGLVAE